jgi:hypothetical protein
VQLDKKGFSPNIIRMAKSRRMRWEGHVTRVATEDEFKVLVGKHE